MFLSRRTPLANRPCCWAGAWTSSCDAARLLRALAGLPESAAASPRSSDAGVAVAAADWLPPRSPFLHCAASLSLGALLPCCPSFPAPSAPARSAVLHNGMLVARLRRPASGRGCCSKMHCCCCCCGCWPRSECCCRRRRLLTLLFLLLLKVEVKKLSLRKGTWVSMVLMFCILSAEASTERRA